VDPLWRAGAAVHEHRAAAVSGRRLRKQAAGEAGKAVQCSESVACRARLCSANFVHQEPTDLLACYAKSGFSRVHTHVRRRTCFGCAATCCCSFRKGSGSQMQRGEGPDAELHVRQLRAPRQFSRCGTGRPDMANNRLESSTPARLLLCIPHSQKRRTAPVPPPSVKF